MGYLEDSQKAGRHIMPDLVRAFALLGIVVVNVGAIAYSMDLMYYDGGFKSTSDHAAYFGVSAIALLKSFTLFSFMFGAGLAYQIQAAQRRGIAFGPRYFRRLIGLAVLGLAHVFFAFMGDILFVYALLGVLLFAFKDAKVKTLIIWGLIFCAVQALIMVVIALVVWGLEVLAPEDFATILEEMKTVAAPGNEVMRTGSFLDVAVFRIMSFGEILLAGLSTQGIMALGMFLLGLAAVKSEIISNPHAPFWRKARRIYLPIGILISLAGAYMSMGAELMSGRMMGGMALLFIGSPVSTAGYLGLIAKWAEGPPSRLKLFMARGGTATLTAYLLQSLILSVIFCGYGFGYYGKLGAASCIAIGLSVGMFTIIFASLWRKYFSRGPFEMLLRKWTYLGAR